MNFDGIEYREIERFKGYLIGEDGSVLSYWGTGVNNKIQENYHKLTYKNYPHHYSKVSLKISDGVYKQVMIHRLVCEAFLGEPGEKMVASHLDGNKYNNHISNLIWETHKDNLNRKKEHGTHDQGCNNSRAKLNREQIVEMKKLLKEGNLKQYEIAEKFDVHRVFVTKVANNNRYANE